MKRTLKAFVLGVLLTILAWTVLNYRLIITSESTILTKKSELSFSGTITDTREWGATDWIANPGIVRDLVARGLGRLTGSDNQLPGNTQELIGDVKDKTKDAVNRGLERAQEALKD